MDTRPYRLTWPSGTAMFDVSPGQVYNIARERFKAAGARVPKGCFLQHVSAVLTNGAHLEDEGWTEKLESLGYRGDRPSIWLMQGLEGLSFEGLQRLLGYASGLAMKGSMFAGEVAFNALGANFKEEAEESLTRLFLSNGFRVQTVHHEDMSKDTDEMRTTMDLGVLASSLWSLFVAQQQKLSEQQLAIISREIQLAEEAGNEEGFEDG
ncbi:hypothetical protein O6H91_02G047300 [Diphasiastrum complanatum]|nr:hypothetical protein O6H91_02G047300 [Diphasiastrum complanatum]